MSQPLDWDLTGDKPTVLILHSHATESFAPTGEYLSSAAYRTQDTAQNMVSVGAYVAELLEAGGISVLHDRTLHDSPSYDAAYTNSRATAQSYLEASKKKKKKKGRLFSISFENGQEHRYSQFELQCFWVAKYKCHWSRKLWMTVCPAVQMKYHILLPRICYGVLCFGRVLK